MSRMSIFTRAKNGLLGQTKPENPHSLENLKYLYGILNRNPMVNDANRDSLIETLRSISEILIWGDQNDSSVFDFFLERGMLIYFLNYMRQKNGRFICIQALQTLNILFENIRHETSLYYLLSNNHVNNIIVHSFDFSDEEVTAYYISFLKTLSLKLNGHSINFFYNERNNEFPLYVEAIKFFNHSETMVRIAVRTLTLNVYKVPDPAMHRFILDRTATEYFSNLVWFIRSHIFDFDKLIRNNRDINSRNYLTSSVEEYLDHIHYLQDIFLLGVNSLNVVLKEQLMNRLLIPIYIFSLVQREKFSFLTDPRLILDRPSAFFLLAEFFLVIRYPPVIEELTSIILSADIETIEDVQRRYGEETFYNSPPMALDVCLPKSESLLNKSATTDGTEPTDEKERTKSFSLVSSRVQNVEPHFKPVNLYISNWSDDEKLRQGQNRTKFDENELKRRPYFEALIEALDCQENDQLCFYALSVLLTMAENPAVDDLILQSVSLTFKSSDKTFYNQILVDRLCEILRLSTLTDSNIRIVTLTLTINLLKKLVLNENEKISYLADHHLAQIEQNLEQMAEILRRYYRQQEIFLDLFEDEFRQMQINPFRLEYLLKDPCMLFVPTTTPLSGVEFVKRLPSGDIEKSRRSIRVYFLLRSLSLELRLMTENDLPLSQGETLLKENDKIDLNNSDLIACTVHLKEKKDRRFLVTDRMQFILIEPDVKILGWGIVKFCDLMQDVEVNNDKEDTRSLHITIHKPANNIYVKSNPPVLNAKFTFDDHIRCMTAKQNLSKGRQKARQTKLAKIASILEIIEPTTTNNYPNASNYFSSSTTNFSTHQFGLSTATISNHPGRATLISGAKRQTTTSNIPISNIHRNSSNSASSPTFGNLENIRRYSLSRTPSEQNYQNPSRTSTPSRTRRTSNSDSREKLDSLKSNAPKSLLEWHEQPANLLEQPPLSDKVNVQILSPNAENATNRFFVDRDMESLVLNSNSDDFSVENREKN